MNGIGQTWAALLSVFSAHPAGAFVLGLAVVALVHSALGLGRARQWYMLPVAFGLLALVGFLLNPIADSNTALDLRSQLTSYEALTTLCVAQFLLASLTLTLSLRLEEGSRARSSAFWLSMVQAIPAPVLVIGLLMIEQAQLAEFPGARPEPVGRLVGFLAGGSLLMIAISASLVPSRWLAIPHHVLSVAILLACMFAPLLQDTLPQSLWHIETESLGHLWKVLIGAALIVLVGAWWRPRNSLHVH